jgi:hypothetical protein
VKKIVTQEEQREREVVAREEKMNKESWGSMQVENLRRHARRSQDSLEGNLVV